MLLALAVCLSQVGPAFGQGGGVDPTQIFQSLTPEQQDQILQQLGGTGLSSILGGGSAQGQFRGAGRATNISPETLQNQQELRARTTPSEEEEGGPSTTLTGIPILRGEDTVIIEVGFVLPPRPLQLQVGGPQLSPSAQSIQQALATGAPAGSAAAQQAAAAALGTAAAAQLVTQGGLGTAGQIAAAGQLGQAGGPPIGGQQQGLAPGQLPGQLVTPSAPGAESTYMTYPGAEAPLTEEDIRRMNALIDLIRTRNPYKLSKDGLLNLPGFAPIPLAGLTDEQATLRLKVEPSFRFLDVRLTHLPLRKTGVEALKPFGYDLFDRTPSTFAPVTNIPVPSDYIIGSGDELQVQLYGTQNRAFTLVVQRDGHINFPQLGPINVAGQRFGAAKSAIESRVEREMIGTRASVSMGDTRAIRVFVLGDVRRPGSYVVSGLGTITSGLYASGGVRLTGSLRRVQLKRQGQLVRELDLYDLLIRGNTADDAKLLQGDVIFIPPIGKTVSVAGEVQRPAIYEIKNETSVNDAVMLAGGLTPRADPALAMLSRIDAQHGHMVVPADLGGPNAAAQGLRNGDVLRVPTVRPTLDDGVVLIGHVFTPGDYAYSKGMRVTDVIHSVNDLQPDADLHYVLIRRELPPDRHVVALSSDVGVALASPRSSADVELMPRDRIYVFDQEPGRERIIKPVIDELKLAGTALHPTSIVHVDGRVKAAGDYPLEAGMTVADLIRAGGGLSVAAYSGKAELSRYQVVNGQTRRMELINVDLGAALRGDPEQNLKLAPFDNLSVKEVSQWSEQESVMLIGEVRFPGRYVVKNGETLRSVIARAGGLTEYAFPEGSVFTREGLRRREQEQIDMLTQRMQTDLITMALQGTAAGLPGAGNAVTVGQSLLGQIRSTRAVGRLVINLPRLIRERPGGADDVVLRDADQLIVPRFQQQVTVIGEVQSVTSHLYTPDLRRDDYIGRSGGLTRRADSSKIYVVRADGSVVANSGGRWFQNSSVVIKPGDTIVVPLNIEKLPPLPFWQAVTSILYNVAIAAAAIHAL
jgi:protein involved in polysaccharide export with SLBB domain